MKNGIPFQLQVNYTRADDGKSLMRVMTKHKETGRGREK
jgi:hypothetical protein